MKKKYFTSEEARLARNAQLRTKRLLNPEQFRARDRAYAAANPEAIRGMNRRKQLKSRYGLTPAQYEAMWESQGGLCRLCLIELPLRGMGTTIDHCHATGQVRGILCASCNTRLGVLEKRGQAGLIKDIDYLGWP